MEVINIERSEEFQWSFQERCGFMIIYKKQGLEKMSMGNISNTQTLRYLTNLELIWEPMRSQMSLNVQIPISLPGCAFFKSSRLQMFF